MKEIEDYLLLFFSQIKELKYICTRIEAYDKVARQYRIDARCSRCGLWTSSISITSEVVRNAGSQAPAESESAF